MRKWQVVLVGLLVFSSAVWLMAQSKNEIRGAIYQFYDGIQVSSISSVTSTTTGNTALVLPNGSVGAAELTGATLRVAYCGQLAENGEIFLGSPALTAVEPALADATCDGFDSATEATADVVLSTTATLYPKMMRCTLNGTLGASETLTAQLRDDTANVSGVVCSMAVGETTCEVRTPTAAAIAAGSAIAVEANEASDNADDDLKCVVWYAVQ